MGPAPLCVQKSPARKISMQGSALACAGDLGIALHMAFPVLNTSLKPSLHLDVDANENLIGFLFP